MRKQIESDAINRFRFRQVTHPFEFYSIRREIRGGYPKPISSPSDSLTGINYVYAAVTF